MVSNSKSKLIYIYILLFGMIYILGGYKLKATENFSHVAFDSLLQKNVKNGKVYYQGFNTQPFKDYIYEIAHATPQDWPRDEQLAFWLNTYNACVISNMVIYGSIESPLKKKGFFDVDKFSVAGMELSLNQIENEVIRANFPTYLVHFGLVCAALGCPKLNDRAFCPKTVKKQLEINMHEYMTSPTGARLDRESKTLRLSKIMEWYHKDFDIGGGKKKLLEVVTPYLKQDDADFVKANKSNIIIDFFEYDWTSNETSQRPTLLKVKPSCK